MKGTIIILAVGDSKWGQLALSLCLSIKANDSEQNILLVYEESAVKEIKPLIPRYFDYLHQVDFSEYKSNNEKAFRLKTKIYGIAKTAVPREKQFLMIDADCIILPSKKVSDWFNELEGTPFTAWCNDVYDFKTKTRSRNDYTFWHDIDSAKRDYGFMPQINSSFIYFEICEKAKVLFYIADHIENINNATLYKGVVPDELYFNIACMETNLLPHQVPFYPIFFQFASEYQDISYIYHYYRAIGFAGEQRPSDWFVKLYNDTANYYRCFFGINDYLYDFKPIDEGEIKLNGTLKCLARAGELPNSDGGVFNPDGIILPNGGIMTVCRKEKNLDAYKKTYTHNTAIACAQLSIDCDFANWNVRVEDFRLFSYKGDVYCNHKNISKDGKIWITFCEFSCLPQPDKDTLVQLPIKTNKVENNWMFFERRNTLYCIYSLFPYRLFFLFKDKWIEEPVNQYPNYWFHKGQFVCNSTNPIDIGEFYLMFFHTKEKSVYFHGAVLIDKVSLEIKHATKNSIHIMDNAKGLQDGLVYVSGSVYLERKNIVRVYFGEADWNAWQIDFNKGELVEAIINSSNS
jgi:hypothetical protein